MRSDTLTPLLQIAKWFGIEPFLFNGIDYDGSSLNPPNKKLNLDNCECVLQHPWMSKSYFSRDDFIEMIRLAEEVFIQEAGTHPAPVQILGEVHDLPKIDYRTKNYPCVMPRYACDFNEFGVYTLQKIANPELVRTGLDDEIADIFKFYFQLPENYQNVSPDQLVFYFAENDCEWHSDWGVRNCEIRPIVDVVIAPDGTVTAQAPAYLFKKPELDEATECLPHALETYVEYIDVYLKINDITQQGCFWCKQEPCNNYPCKDNNYPLCFNTSPIGYSYSNKIQGCPIPAVPQYDCTHLLNGNVEIPMKHYSLCCPPRYLTMNYITGHKLNHGFICNDYFEILIRLGLGLMDCVRDWCVCPGCFDDKIKYWRTVESVKIAEGAKQGVVGDQWKILLTDQTLNYLNGLPPYRGITFALRGIRKMECSDTFTGGMFA